MEMDSLLIERTGTDPVYISAENPIVIERPGDDLSPVWMMCDIEIACGRYLVGAVRFTPPQIFRGAPAIPRTTAILAIVNNISVNLLSGTERARAGLSACQTIPLKFRLREKPPFITLGLDGTDPSLPLEPWIWTKEMDPVDLADDVTKLAPMAW
jgi:hypothetical protein